MSVYMKLDDDQRVLEYVFLVMEYCGTSLADYVKQNPADQRDVTWLRDVVGVVIYDVACGLKYLGKCGVFHRDLTPGNVCIETSSSPPRSKIVDFGYARRRPENSRSITHGICTAAYRSPEHLLGPKYKDQNDIWALGCILGFVVSSDHLFKDGNRILDTISEYIGKPSQRFLDRITEEQNIDNTRVNQSLFDWLKKLNGNPGYRRIESLFDNLPYCEEKEVAIKLMRNMLKWDCDERITVQGILDSDFIQLVRTAHPSIVQDSNLDEIHCQSVSDGLGRLEQRIKEVVDDEGSSRELKSQTLQGYLTSAITEKFSYVEEWDDHYEYSLARVE